MEKQELLKQFAKPEDKLLIAKIIDKINFTRTRNQVQVTAFLDSYQQTIAQKALQTMQAKDGILFGGYEEAERKVLIFIPDKMQSLLEDKNKIFSQFIKVISIILPQDLKGTFHHRDYLSGLMKLGIKREKIGDILVNEEGANILVTEDMASYLETHLTDLTRFQKSIIEIKELSNLQIIPVKKEQSIILVPQLRLDVVISEILHLSRSKANEIIGQERVFVNYEIKTKNASQLKQGDILTIRGKGKFEIGEIVSQTAKGKIRLQVNKYVS